LDLENSNSSPKYSGYIPRHRYVHWVALAFGMAPPPDLRWDLFIESPWVDFENRLIPGLFNSDNMPERFPLRELKNYSVFRW